MDNLHTISRFDESLTYIVGESLTRMYVYIHWCPMRQPCQRQATEDSFFKDTSNLALKQAGVRQGSRTKRHGVDHMVWMISYKWSGNPFFLMVVSWKSLYFWDYPQVLRKMCVNHHSYGGGVDQHSPEARFVTFVDISGTESLRSNGPPAGKPGKWHVSLPISSRPHTNLGPPKWWLSKGNPLPPRFHGKSRLVKHEFH